MISNSDFYYSYQFDSSDPSPEEVVLYIKAPGGDFEEVEVETIKLTPIEGVNNNIVEFLVPAEYIQNPGTYWFRLAGYEFETLESKECYPRPYSSEPPPQVCIITGNIRNIGGQTEIFENVEVSVKPLKLPMVVGSTITLGRSLRTVTDFDGYFSLPAIRGSTVLLEVKDAALRFQAVIPDQDTIRLEDLIPQS